MPADFTPEETMRVVTKDVAAAMVRGADAGMRDGPSASESIC